MLRLLILISLDFPDLPIVIDHQDSPCHHHLKKKSNNDREMLDQQTPTYHSSQSSRIKHKLGLPIEVNKTLGWPRRQTKRAVMIQSTQERIVMLHHIWQSQAWNSQSYSMSFWKVKANLRSIIKRLKKYRLPKSMLLRLVIMGTVLDTRLRKCTNDDQKLKSRQLTSMCMSLSSLLRIKEASKKKSRWFRNN